MFAHNWPNGQLAVILCDNVSFSFVLQYNHAYLALRKICNGIFIPLLTLYGAFSTNILVGRTCVVAGDSSGSDR